MDKDKQIEILEKRLQWQRSDEELYHKARGFGSGYTADQHKPPQIGLYGKKRHLDGDCSRHGRNGGTQ